jgi:hypothetical protein
VTAPRQRGGAPRDHRHLARPAHRRRAESRRRGRARPAARGGRCRIENHGVLRQPEAAEQRDLLSGPGVLFAVVTAGAFAIEVLPNRAGPLVKNSAGWSAHRRTPRSYKLFAERGFPIHSA